MANIMQKNYPLNLSYRVIISTLYHEGELYKKGLGN